MITREMLLSKGFTFNDDEYLSGCYYEYRGENGTEETNRIAQLLGFTNDGTPEDLLICCTEDLSYGEACCYSEEKHFNREEFESLVNRM